MDNTVFLNLSLNIDIEEICEILFPLFNRIDQMMESVEPVLNNVFEMISKIIECINSLIDEIIKTYSLTELSIPNSSISICDTDCLSQAPPVGVKSIKELALENLSYNMNRYKNHKIIKLIKHEFPPLVRELFYAYIIRLVSKALGMQ